MPRPLSDKPEIFHLGGHTVALHAGYTVTMFADGLTVEAVAEATPEYEARAEALGYGPDTALMSQEHEVAHALLATWLGQYRSPTLYGVASGHVWQHWQKEEAAVLALQALARALNVSLIDLARRMSSVFP